MPDLDSCVTVRFPSREELKNRGYSPETLEQYDLWRTAHAEGQKLACRLSEVFGSPERPRITLHVARGYDDEWQLTDARVAELAALDLEHHWSEVTAEATHTFQEYFAFSDPEGWRFYLPAFIYHYLADFPLSGYDAVYWACVRKTHCGFLTDEQMAFIGDFVALCHKWVKS